jgi:iron complex outermembrane receptor protein
VWGGGIRQVSDTVSSAFDSWFIPESYNARTYNGFLQDEIAFAEDSIKLTLGSKFEWNSFSKFEVQPTARLLWAPTQSHRLWTAVSRAVRVPSRNEIDQYEIDSIAENDDGEVEYELLVASPAFKPEKLTSYEAGYRFVATRRVSIDVATFYNNYDDLQTIETDAGSFAATHISGVMIPLVRSNNAYGRVVGAEFTAFWTVNDVLRLSGNYTRLHMRLRAREGSNDDDIEGLEGKNAKHLMYFRAYADLPRALDFAAELRYVGAIPGEEIPGYLDGNLHMSRAIREGLRLSVTLDNLIHRRHAEWDSGGLMQSRALRAGLRWSF